MKYSEIIQKQGRRDDRSRKTPIIRLGVKTADFLGLHGGPLLKLLVLSKMRGFLQHIVLELMDRDFPEGALALKPGMDRDIHHDFLELASDLNLVTRFGDVLTIDPVYTSSFPGSGKSADTSARSQAAADYTFIRSLIHRSEESGESGPLNRKDVRYLITLSQYLLELESMRFDSQIAPSFDETFYSDLGALAYHLYTKRSFERLCRRLAPASVLDIGCGNGLHLESVLALSPNTRVVGLEPQAKVADSTRLNLSRHPHTRIEPVDFLEYRTEERFDMVLSSFMLFYMPEEERVPFFRRIHDVLSPEGTYVLGQYFPDFENVQEVVIKATSPVPDTQLALCEAGNSLVKAESLLNRTLSDFRSVAYWDRVHSQLTEAGLAVEEIIPADGMYYSYFLLIRRTESSPARRST